MLGRCCVKNFIQLVLLHIFLFCHWSHYPKTFSHWLWWISSGIKTLQLIRFRCSFWFFNHLCYPSRYHFNFINVSSFKCVGQVCAEYSRCGQRGDLCRRRIISLFLYSKLRQINPSTLLTVLKLYFDGFYHLRSSVMIVLYWYVNRSLLYMNII